VNLVPWARREPARPPVPPRLAFTERYPAGIRFTERMTGWWSDAPGPISLDDPLKRKQYEDAYARGEQAGQSLELVLTIASQDLEKTLRHPRHCFGFFGSATITGLPDGPAASQTLMARGHFELFVPHADEVSTSQMLYSALLTTADRHAWWLKGFKSLRQGGGVGGFGEDDDRRGVWRDQTRLYFKLWQRAGDAPVKLGIATVSVSDFIKQLSTIRPTGTFGPVEACDTVSRFLVFYGGVLRDTYGGPFARSRYAPPNWWDRERRPLRAPAHNVAPESPVRRGNGILVPTRDGISVRLTRYTRTDAPNPRRGPVILAPGFGVRAASFAIDTVDVNFVEYLCANDWDVWLFDYRASPSLPTSGGDYSVDHIAQYDWPAAIEFVHARTNKPVKVIAHCVAAMSFMMAAVEYFPEPLRNRIAGVILSQVAAHPIGAPLNELKALARVAFWLQLFGVKSIRITVQAADTYHRPFLDRLLRLYPTHDPCDNPVCRRIRFAFGESYRHANLNRATHDAIIEMFGNPRARREYLRPAYTSLRALRHLALIIREETIVHEDGQPYLEERRPDQPPLAALLPFPLTLLSGRKNVIFPPEGIDTTQCYLKDKIPRLQPMIRLPEYAHMDCFIGARASDDVFSLLEQRLR
jgi:cholesterol oxidase